MNAENQLYLMLIESTLENSDVTAVSVTAQCTLFNGVVWKIKFDQVFGLNVDNEIANFVVVKMRFHTLAQIEVSSKIWDSPARDSRSIIETTKATIY